MSDALVRLAVVLPLLMIALGGVLWAVKRGLIRLPGATIGLAPLKIVQVVILGPGARLAVVEFAGARLLLGVSRDGITRLGSE